MKDISTKIGRNLKRIRTEKKMSQGDRAKKLGVHRSYISELERGMRTTKKTLTTT